MKYATKKVGLIPTDGFRVITIGTGSPSLDLERVSPCTMVQYKDTCFAVDLGYGASRRMMELGMPPATVKHVLFTHLHSDHSLDYGYFVVAGWTMGRRELHTVGPKGIIEMHDAYTKMYDSDIMYRANLGNSLSGIKEDVDFREVVGGETFEMNGVKISTLEVPHTAFTVAYKFEADGKSVVVSGDLMYHQPFEDFARGADMVVLDANQANSVFIENKPASFVANLEKSHATVEGIATMAKNAEAKAVILTHMTPNTYVGELVTTFSSIYKGEIIPAFDLMAVDII